MKARFIFALALVSISFFAFKLKNHAILSSGNIHVEVHGIDKIEGQVGILLFEHKEGFPSDQDAALQHVLLPLKGSTLSYSFRELPYGTYAVSVMHDANMNNQLDTNIFGIPKEGTGTSNNAKGNLSAPKFSDACFMLDKADFTTSIELNY